MSVESWICQSNHLVLVMSLKYKKTWDLEVIVYVISEICVSVPKTTGLLNHPYPHCSLKVSHYQLPMLSGPMIARLWVQQLNSYWDARTCSGVIVCSWLERREWQQHQAPLSYQKYLATTQGVWYGESPTFFCTLNVFKPQQWPKVFSAQKLIARHCARPSTLWISKTKIFSMSSNGCLSSNQHAVILAELMRLKVNKKEVVLRGQ